MGRHIKVNAADVLRTAHDIAKDGGWPNTANVARVLRCSKPTVGKFRDELRKEGLWPWANDNRGHAPKANRPRPSYLDFHNGAAKERPRACVPSTPKLYATRLRKPVQSLEEWQRISGPMLHGPGWKPKAD